MRFPKDRDSARSSDDWNTERERKGQEGERDWARERVGEREREGEREQEKEREREREGPRLFRGRSKERQEQLGRVIRPIHFKKRARQLLNTVLWTAAGVGIVGLAGYTQYKAKTYINKKVLPPAAVAVSAALGREVSLGRVQALNPLGLKIGPVYVGPEKHEFSCGHVDSVSVSVSAALQASCH